MTQPELEEIAKRYCDSLHRLLLRNIPHFEEDWDGCHVRAVAWMIQEVPHPSVKKAIRQIRKSGQHCAMNF